MRFKGFDLNLLVALDALLAEKSVSRAAKRLNISQPAASAALNRLRGHFHDDILSSAGKRMFPTSHAETVAPILAEVLAGIERLVTLSTVFDPATSRRTFRIAASDHITTLLLTPLIPIIEREAPDIRLEIVLPSGDNIGRLDRGDLDLIIAPDFFVSPQHPADLLFEERYVVAGWSGNPIFQKPLTEDVFFDQGHVVVEIGPHQSAISAEIKLGESGRRRRIEVVAPLFSTVPWMLLDTNRIAMMHERLAVAMAQNLPLTVAPLPFASPAIREVIQYHRTRQHDEALQWLLAHIKAQAATSLRA